MWALTYGFLAKALGLQAEGPGARQLLAVGYVLWMYQAAAGYVCRATW